MAYCDSSYLAKTLLLKQGRAFELLKEGNFEAPLMQASKSSKAFRADLTGVSVSTRDIYRPAHSCPHAGWAEQRQ